MSEWQDMKSAPRDGTWILAQTGSIADDRYHHLSRRCFVVCHLGRTDRMGLDLGWSLYPGFGVGDEWLSGWMPLPTTVPPHPTPQP